MAATRQNQWLEEYPDLGSGPLSTEPYISPAYYESEKERIFKRVWLYAGRVEEVANPGDYKVKRLEAADTSVIIIRGKDGNLRAFHNVCSHRANTVITESGVETFGRARGNFLTCRFHGWVYDAHGDLVQVPQEDHFYECFDKRENGLSPVHCEEWEGFIFVCVAAEPPGSLVEYLGGYAEHFAGFPYDEISYGFTYETILKCNWKIAIDSFSEAYHVETIHAGSFPNTFSGGLTNVKFYGPHRTSGVGLTLKAKPTPVVVLTNSLTRSSLAGQAESTMLPPRVNPDKAPDFSFELSCVFPNFLLHVSEGIWFTHVFWPMARDATLWEGRYYVREPETYGERWAIEHAMNLQRNAWLEDTATMEDTHRAMMSGVKRQFHVQDDEILIRHSHKTVEEYVNS